MNEDYFVYVKLINGEQLMALKIDECEDYIVLKFPMLLKMHMVKSTSERISEQVTAGPYIMFAQQPIIEIQKQHVLIDTELADNAIPHYVGLVKEHEGVTLGYNPNELVWEDEWTPEANTVEEIAEKIERLSEKIKTIEIDDKDILEGNDTIH